MSKFYNTDPRDPEAPRELAEYAGGHGTVRPGDRVAYVNAAGTSLPGPLIVTEIIDFGEDQVLAVLNGGEYECDAADLRAAGAQPAT